MLTHPLWDGGVELERGGRRGDGHRYAGGIEDPGQSPHPGPAAVLVVRLGRRVGLRRLDAGLGVLPPAVVAIVAPPHRVLAALLVDEHQVDGHARVLRPFEARGVAAVADKIALAHGVRDQVTTSVSPRYRVHHSPPRRSTRAWPTATRRRPQVRDGSNGRPRGLLRQRDLKERELRPGCRARAPLRHSPDSRRDTDRSIRGASRCASPDHPQSRSDHRSGGPRWSGLEPARGVGGQAAPSVTFSQPGN